MNILRVKLGARSYDICIGVRLEGIGRRLKHLLKPKRGTRAHIVTHPALKSLYGGRLSRSLSQGGFQVSFGLFPSGERQKNLRTLGNLYSSCARARLRRSSVIVALGGGVAGDVAGFLAATYLRGLKFVNVPTTLLAMVDSAIGGKTGVDLPDGKNLAGAVHQPSLVWCDLSTLRTLPVREWKTGMAEIIKSGLIGDPGLFRFVEKLFRNGPPCPMPPKAAEHMAARSAAIKADVVSRDELETRGLRQILNFGHTAGHALEASTGYREFTHGEAISVGMVIAGRIALKLGLFSRPEQSRLENLLRAVGLPTRAPAPAFGARFWAAMSQDKKIEGDEFRFVLPVRIGNVTVRSVARSVVAKALIP